MITLLTILLSVLFTFFAGYWLHKLFHMPISGPFYKAHMNHHTVQYPPENYTSDVYRGAGKDNTLFYFILAFSPIIALIIASHFVAGISVWTCICILASMIGTGLLHDFIHDGFHLNKSFWHHLPFFDRWNDLHKIHHEQMDFNFGIFNFVCDKLFKTFKD